MEATSDGLVDGVRPAPRELWLRWNELIKNEGVRASLVLALILNVLFFPALWGGRTLLMSAWDAASVMQSGAYHEDALGRHRHISRTPDPGAPAWASEPWLKIVADQYWGERNLPLWNPYSAYGTPLAAAMQPQPFYPLTFILSLHPTAWTYNFLVVGRLFVAGLLTFLFARLFLGFSSSLFAAIAFMLSGYFIIYMDMPHVSVEVLLPGVFLAFETLMRRNSWGAVAGAAGVILLCATGGMPESLFLIVSFGCVYFVFRLAVAPEFRDRAFARLAKFAAALALGFALSAFLLLPFLEFMRVVHDTHQVANIGAQVGLGFDGDGRAAATYLLPMVFGPVGNSILSGGSGWTGMRGYWGIVPCLFALAAVLFCFFPTTIRYVKPLRSLTAFFALSLTLMVLKQFGHPIINWIGGLPLAEMIVFQKYLGPLMAFCAAMLAGIGFSLLVEGRAKPAYFVRVALLTLGVILALAGWSLPQLLEADGHVAYYYVTVLAGVLVAAIAVALLSRPGRSATWLAWAFLGLLCVELSVGFILPCFYVLSSLPSAKMDPYAGAPYLDFLRARNQEHYRVFGRDGLLYPDWSGVFGLADVRSLDAMLYRRYRTFIRSFLLNPGDEARRSGDLADRFTGSETGYAYEFETDTERRFLALSSIKYLISAHEYGVSSKVLDEILAQHKAENLWGVGAGVFELPPGKPVAVLFEHPPSSRLTYKTTIDPQRPMFAGVAAIKAEAQDKNEGVRFLIEIRCAGQTGKLFSTFLDPRDVPADRGGRPFQLDLTAYAGKEVELLFSTEPGPSGSNAFGWAGWAGLRFAPNSPTAPTKGSDFNEVYDREVLIYEDDAILPRASLFRAAEVLPDDDVLARLKDPAFDLRGKVILSAESLPKQDAAELQFHPDAEAAPVAAARITSYESQRVTIEAEASTPSVLMLNDTNFPGWRAFVNGRPEPILQADYLFRGVIVPAGKSVVEFSYEPASFRAGAWISATALVAIAALVGLPLRRRKRLRTAPRHEPPRSS